MADLLLSSLIPIVLQKSTDSLVQRMGEMWGIDDQRKKLHHKLLAVHDVLTDAEEQGDDKPSVKSWLAELKSAAYDADNVLDEFCYEELRRDAVARGHKAGNVSHFFSVENPVLFRYKMSRKLKEVVGRIDELVTEMERFKFVQGRQGRVLQHVGTHSYVIESEVIGREGDKEKLVTLLTQVCPSENLMVLPVVGMGGLGKTTLAQLVYNDPRVKDHFKLLVWVCVSEEFDVEALTKLIIDTIVKKDCKVPRDNMELLQKRLREEIYGKRYLLVLDDVWNENGAKWEQLRDLLNCGDIGSVVLVTTRSGRVADVMGTIPTHNLGYFNEEDSWKLFHRRAFGTRIGECEELVEIGKKLVKKCQGLPLAIKTLGSLMSYKNEVGQWKAVLEQSMIWENKQANDDGGVLSVLRLSYDHLPSYMKQCFAFCAVFPKNYVMEKEKLVQYWIAHGFIPSDGLGGLEMSGSDIFNELALRSFFQNVETVWCDPYSTFYSQTTCKMHDLMHDLAQSVMRDECLSIVGPLQMKNTPKCNVRHILLGNPREINVAIKCFPTTRSLILSTRREFYYVEDVGYVKSNFLRILDVCNNPIENMTTLRTMKHLRYLELSVSYSTTISETISTLYLLQTLRLYDCRSLSKLPEGMRYMKSLRHFYIDDCSNLKCMPPSLGELQYLQTLTHYVVGTGVQNRIGELKTLNLGGELYICNIREIRDARDAREANMVSKQNLEHLALCWGMPRDDFYYDSSIARSNGSEAEILDLSVLDALKPCNKLKSLRIEEYRGCNFPVWMTEYQMLENLVALFIIECKWCTSVPPLYMLPLLQTLFIISMDNLRHLCCGVFMSAKNGEDAPKTFPSLKSLILNDMSNLDCWCEGDVSKKTSLIFPVLTELWIIRCPKLTAIPIAPSLERMTITENETLSCSVTRLTTIRTLTLKSRGGRQYSVRGGWQYIADETLSFKPWVSLENLTIEGFNHIIPPTDGREGAELSVDVNATALRCVFISDSNFFSSSIPSNSPLWLWKCFRFIELLQITNCDNLTFWPEEELSNLIYLQIISICDCRNFIGSLFTNNKYLRFATRQVLLPKLKYFFISNCPNVVEVPKLPRSLERLEMDGCVKLESLPEWLCSLVGLKVLRIISSESLNSLPSSIGCLIALESLWIEDCFNLESLPEGMQGLESLKKLTFTNCPKIRILPEWLCSLVGLKELTISSLRSLNSLPSSIGCLIALEYLRIHDCFNLESLPEGMQGLESLKELTFTECHKISILPEGLLQRLRSLDCLVIRWCPLLQRDFQKHGKYWHLISEIPRRMIDRSSKIGDLTLLIKQYRSMQRRKNIPRSSVRSYRYHHL